MTTEYLVTWEINIDADSPEEAAAKALEIQRDPNSFATFFDTENLATGEHRAVDALD